ncbi:General secretion pathway protein F [methanotrophic bacterial endosymbiont of Bathymodiolus sp.]|nr:General secretion pathway protein F [methanotrophic bacterial endosymbiont of Bathymodiolus sp.]
MTGKKAGRFDRELSNREVVLLTRQLASLLQARLALAQALAALVEQAEKPLIRERINSIRSEVVSGTPLSQALAQYPKAFPEMYVATVAAGENTGDLGGVLSKLADALEARQALQQKVSAAFIYPAIVTVVALMVVIGLLTYVVPQVVSVFESNNQALPTLTVVMIALSDLLRDWGWLMALALALAIYLFRNALKNKAFKLKFDEFVLTIPVVGPFIRAVNTARLASTLSILVGSGVPILKALAAANRTLGNSALQLAMVDVQERVKEGSGLSKAMGKSGLFPPVLTHLVASGEATGQLAAMLERASDSQRTEVERKAMWLTSLMEPILILVMGLIVLLIVLAVMMPIIEVNQLIQ